MSTDDDGPDELTLIAYERMTDHGFALPCFGLTAGANTVYVARPSRPGDPTTRISGFEIYDAECVELLPQDKRGRHAKAGDPWLDVFLWAGEVYIGTKHEIWNSTAPVRDDITENAPMSLLDLAEGIADVAADGLTSTTYVWLQQRLGYDVAAAWQIDVYLRGLAIRGLRRRLGKAIHAGRVRLALQKVRLSLNQQTLTIKLPATLTELLKVTATDLYDLIKAANEFGFQAEIVREGANRSVKTTIAGTTLLMRLRRGRGKTQTQIPFRVLDAFFGDEIRVRAHRTGHVRDMTLSKSEDRRNTMKLQLPEMQNMRDPVARFKRTASGITYEIYDMDSIEGKEIKKVLDVGLQNGTTHQTQGAATWWHIF